MSSENQFFVQAFSPSPLKPQRGIAKAYSKNRRKKKAPALDYEEIIKSKFAPAIRRTASESESDKENLSAKKAKLMPLPPEEEIEKPLASPEGGKKVLLDMHFNASEYPDSSLLTPKSTRLYSAAYQQEGYQATGRRGRTWSRIDDIGSEALDLIKTGPDFLGGMPKKIADANIVPIKIDEGKSVVFSHSSHEVAGRIVTINHSHYPKSGLSDMRVLGIGKYTDISIQLKALASEAGDKTIANSIWEIAKGSKPSHEFTDSESKLVTSIAILLFGVESQRDNGAIIVGAMFLDLVQDGILEMKDIEKLPMSKVGAKGASRKLGSLAFEEIRSHEKDPKLKSELMDDFLQKYYDIVVHWTCHKLKMHLDPAYHIEYITKCIYSNFERWFGVKPPEEEAIGGGAAAATAAAAPLPSLDEIWDKTGDYAVETSDTASTCSLSGISSLDLTLED